MACLVIVLGFAGWAAAMARWMGWLGKDRRPKTELLSTADQRAGPAK